MAVSVEKESERGLFGGQQRRRRRSTAKDRPERKTGKGKEKSKQRASRSAGPRLPPGDDGYGSRRKGETGCRLWRGTGRAVGDVVEVWRWWWRDRGGPRVPRVPRVVSGAPPTGHEMCRVRWLVGWREDLDRGGGALLYQDVGAGGGVLGGADYGRWYAGLESPWQGIPRRRKRGEWHLCGIYVLGASEGSGGGGGGGGS
jgi:hypothetical protein